MNRNKSFAVWAIAALGAGALSAPLRAQEINTPIITVKSSQPANPKPLKSHFEVLHMLPGAIQVRDQVNLLEIHTFAYSDQIRNGMQYLADHGGFRYGDKVTIWYMRGTEVALKIKGKPSKPR